MGNTNARVLPYIFTKEETIEIIKLKPFTPLKKHWHLFSQVLQKSKQIMRNSNNNNNNNKKLIPDYVKLVKKTKL